MPLSSGTRVGPYEITAPLGAGGMGEVYRARDSKLGRDVALKVLSPALAGDADYMARFTREAQVLASLNHPNIAAIYGIEESDDIRALVMELVEGLTLAERISKGPLPLEETLQIARQIAEALEAAHEKGIVHRDLKPANVKITPDGVVKVLDFGLAKVPEQSAPISASSPTLTMRATQAGVIMGTAAYMSPEQAVAKQVDKRADIWSFGVVFWEMLTGRELFSGETVSHTLADVLRGEIDVNKLPAGTPPVVRDLVRRCLDRDVKTRLRDIGEARIVIRKYLVNPVMEERAPMAQPGWRRALPWVLAAVFAVVALAFALLAFRQTPRAEHVLRYSIRAPEKSTIHTFAISPDGHYLAIAALAHGEGKRQLWVQPLDTLAPQALRGTDDARYPFWSPNSRSIGFFAEGKLKRISVDGGPAQTLCDAADGRGGTWNRDGIIIFAPSGSPGPLQRVAAVGGLPAPVTKIEGGDLHRFPEFLPDGRRFLYLVSGGNPDKDGVNVGSLDRQPAWRLVAEQSSATWLPPPVGSKDGYLLFVRENILMAQPFDMRTLQPTGDPFPVAEQVSYGFNVNNAMVSISRNDVLVYWGGASSGSMGENQLVWYDRAGKPLGNVGAPARTLYFALSPDEKTVAVPRRAGSGNNTDIWLHEVARGVETRFTFHTASRNEGPVWSPDGRRIAFFSSRAGRTDLFLKDTSGTGQDELLLESALNKYPTDWSRDGRFLLYTETGSKTGFDLWILPEPGASQRGPKPVPFLQSPFNETQGQFSPDGHWIAYTSDESGRQEIYVRPFPPAAGKWRISVSGGQFPRWRQDSKELFYLAPERKLMAVAVKADVGAHPMFEVAAPQTLFEPRIPSITPGFNQFVYAVAADGKRLLVNTTGSDTVETPLTVVVNWLAAAKK